MSDWIRCDTPEQAIAWLDEQLDRQADEAHYQMVLEGFDEDQQASAMQRVYACLDRARERGMAEIDKAFRRLEVTLH